MKTSIQSEIMKAVDRFPSMPGASAELFTLLQEPDADVAAIEKILRNDPGLTANILKLTNSSYYGFSNKIGSIRQAVTLIGNQKIRQMVMVSCANEFMNQPVSGYELGIGELWRHSIAASVATEGLIRELGLPENHEAFTAALLHDLGKLVLGTFVEQNLGKLEDLSTGSQHPYELAEREVLGIGHAEVGALLLEKWGLPGVIIDTVRWHHEPEAAAAASSTLDLVHMADVLCLMSGIGIGREGLHYKLSSAVTARVDIQAYQIERVASRTLMDMIEIEQINN